jgi:hypothetical protein
MPFYDLPSATRSFFGAVRPLAGTAAHGADAPFASSCRSAPITASTTICVAALNAHVTKAPWPDQPRSSSRTCRAPAV